MFEGKPPTRRVRLPQGLSDAGGENLRAISWSELVAQFDAAREFRAALRDGADGEAEASFDPHSARHIAALGDGKSGVNPDDLANRKPEIAINRSAINGAARADRESR